MKYIAYYRVSTDQQGRSGLGLEAQQFAVNNYLRNIAAHELLGEYTEIESGKSIKNRPMLQEALKVCRKHKAILIIAKLDRLTRNVYFIAGLLESGVEFIATDNPLANKTMIQMAAVFAEYERELISQRIKDALQALKRRGIKLGKNGKNLAKINIERADLFILSIKPIIENIMEHDIITYRGIATELNKRQVPTYKGTGKWYASYVFKMMNKLGI